MLDQIFYVASNLRTGVSTFPEDYTSRFEVGKFIFR
jgi:hypothetical protein